MSVVCVVDCENSSFPEVSGGHVNKRMWSGTKWLRDQGDCGAAEGGERRTLPTRMRRSRSQIDLPFCSSDDSNFSRRFGSGDVIWSVSMRLEGMRCVCVCLTCALVFTKTLRRIKEADPGNKWGPVWIQSCVRNKTSSQCYLHHFSDNRLQNLKVILEPVSSVFS